MIRYDYNNFKIVQIKINNYVTITIYENNKNIFMSHSKRFIERDEVISFIKTYLTKIYKEGII